MTFTSRDTSTATVSGNTLTWRHGGTILVTATVDGFTSAAVSISAAYAPESIKVTDDSGQPVDAVTLRVGESRNLKVTVLPDAASQEFTASAASPDIAVVGNAKPTGITVTPESLTLSVGETASLNVNILPDYAPQEFAVNILDKTIATINSKE